jgi:hypothetical protein
VFYGLEPGHTRLLLDVATELRGLDLEDDWVPAANAATLRVVDLLTGDITAALRQGPIGTTT